MSHAYIIEIGEEAVGLVVKEASPTSAQASYRFYASKKPFLSLDGKIFINPEKARQSALAINENNARRVSALTPLII